LYRAKTLFPATPLWLLPLLVPVPLALGPPTLVALSPPVAVARSLLE
jgi:hypothetical protein